MLNLLRNSNQQRLLATLPVFFPSEQNRLETHQHHLVTGYQPQQTEYPRSGLWNPATYGCVTENVVYPIVPNGFADHYPVMKNGYFIGNIPNIFRQTHISVYPVEISSQKYFGDVVELWSLRVDVLPLTTTCLSIFVGPSSLQAKNNDSLFSRHKKNCETGSLSEMLADCIESINFGVPLKGITNHKGKWIKGKEKHCWENHRCKHQFSRDSLLDILISAIHLISGLWLLLAHLQTPTTFTPVSDWLRQNKLENQQSMYLISIYMIVCYNYVYICIL